MIFKVTLSRHHFVPALVRGWDRGRYWFATYLAVAHLLFNVNPILLQRYTRGFVLSVPLVISRCRKAVNRSSEIDFEFTPSIPMANADNGAGSTSDVEIDDFTMDADAFVVVEMGCTEANMDFGFRNIPTFFS